MKNLIFLCIASAIFIFSVLSLNFAPTINGLVGKGTYKSDGSISSGSNGWNDIACRAFSDH